MEKRRAMAAEMGGPEGVARQRKRGKMTVRLTIDPLGRVTHAEILRSTIAIERMQDCILAKIRRWNDFGIVPREHGDVTIRHTYLFGY
jgi:TonB family protein